MLGNCSASILRLSLLGLVLAPMFALTGCASIHEQALRERETALWRGIQTTKEVVETPGFPRSSSVSLFIRTESIEQALHGLVGARYQIGNDEELRGWYAQIDEAALVPEHGNALVRLGGQAFNEDGKKRLNLKISGVLTVAGLERAEDGKAARLKLDVLPTQIDSKISFGLFRFRTPPSIRQFLADLAIRLDRESLTAVIPLDQRVQFDLISPSAAAPKPHRNYVKDGEDWYVETQMAMTPIALTQYLSFRAPAFLPGGMWLTFDVGDEPTTPPVEAPQPPTDSMPILRELNHQGRLEIAADAAEKEIEPDHSVLHIHRSVFSAPFTAVDQLSPAERTITIRSTASHGYLARDEWDHGILGHGEYYARLATDDAVTGEGTIHALVPEWVPGEGIRFEARANLNVNASVRVHVDPNVGGGIGSTIGLVGSASPRLTGAFRFGVAEFGAYRALVTETSIECKTVEAHIQSDGTFAYDAGWTRVPPVGARFGQLLGQESYAPSVLLTEVPLPAKLSSDSQSSGFAPKYSHALATIAPTAVTVHSEGITVPLDIGVSFTDDPAVLEGIEAARREQRRALEQFALGAEKSCPEPGPFALTLGTLEFGPNNEIVKFFRNGWSDLTEGPGPNNDLVIAINRLGGLMNEATPLDDASLAALRELEQLSGTALGANNEVTKAIRNLKNEAEKLVETPGKAIGDVPKNVLNEAKRVWCGLVKC